LKGFRVATCHSPFPGLSWRTNKAASRQRASC
jgi:hypothetical protein